MRVIVLRPLALLVVSSTARPVVQALGHSASHFLALSSSLWQSLHLHTAFSAWVAWGAARRSARDVMARVVGRFQHRLLAAALAAWQERVRQSKRTRTTAFEVSSTSGRAPLTLQALSRS